MTRKVTSTFISLLRNALPFVGSWAGILLSTVARVALLCSYLLRFVQSAMICAVHRVLCLVTHSLCDGSRS